MLVTLLKRLPTVWEDESQCSTLINELTVIGKTYIADETARSQAITNDLDEALPSAWEALSQSLKTIRTQQQPEDERFQSISDEDEDASGPSSSTSAGRHVSENAVVALGVALARLTRNLLAGSAEAKRVVLRAEPHIRNVAYQVTTFDKIKGERYVNLQRAIFQALSNLFTPVSSTDVSQKEEKKTSSKLDDLCKVYFGGKSREDDIVSRALDSTDNQLNLAVLMLIQNAATTSSFVPKSLASPHGSKFTSRILDKMANRWFEAGTGPEMESETQQTEAERKDAVQAARCFDAGNHVLASVFDAGWTEELYHNVESPGEPISPSQVTLLKLIDAHTHHTHDRSSPTLSSASSYETHGNPPNAFLISILFSLTAYARQSMGLSSVHVNGKLERPAKASPNDDPLLPRVFEGCILVCQCLNNLCLSDDVEQAAELKREVKEARQGDKGTIEALVGLLQDLDLFIPRLKPFRPSPKTNTTQDQDSTQTSDDSPKTNDVFKPFATLKRDIVQLIGTLSFEDKEVQDRVRLCGGVEVILSLCVADEVNPYIREHALFATRHLLMGNAENQSVIGKMDPLGVVDEVTGELREMPERMGMKN